MNEFEFASQRLEVLVDLPGVCARFGASGNFPVAFQTLIHLQQQYLEHRDTLVNCSDKCAVVSDGQTTVPGWNNYYSSAHEAALAIIWGALSVLFMPAISDAVEYEEDEKFTPILFTPIGFKLIPVTDEKEKRERFKRLNAERGKEFDFDHGWIESLKEQIRRERVKVLATILSEPVSPEPTKSEAQVTPSEKAKPKKLLTGWHDITAALDMKYADRDKIKSLNNRFAGPITNQGSGTQPIVDCATLLAWWDKLAQQQQELANQRQGQQLSAEAQYTYGRDAEVSPEISGSVKKRRQQKRPKGT